MVFPRPFLFALVAIASLSVSVNGQDASCPSQDKNGDSLANSTPADSDGLITCTYTGAPGACQYFANGDGLSSGSSDCPDIGGGGASISLGPGPQSLSSLPASSSSTSKPAPSSSALSSSTVLSSSAVSSSSAASSGFTTSTSPSATSPLSTSSASTAASSTAASKPTSSNAAYSVQPGVMSGAGVGAVAVLLSFL